MQAAQINKEIQSVQAEQVRGAEQGVGGAVFAAARGQGRCRRLPQEDSSAKDGHHT